MVPRSVLCTLHLRTLARLAAPVSTLIRGAALGVSASSNQYGVVSNKQLRLDAS
jgi:uncharacterized protein YaaW (UPF0174 family)